VRCTKAKGPSWEVVSSLACSKTVAYGGCATQGVLPTQKGPVRKPQLGAKYGNKP
jgi:hypothetical protein